MSTYENQLRYRKAQLMKKRRRQKQVLIRGGVVLSIICFLVFFFIHQNKLEDEVDERAKLLDKSMPELTVDLLSISEYARPGIQLKEVKGIVIHYTANPGTGAKQNRDYFQGLKDSKLTKASSHFVIGLNGEIIQCIPTSEIAYASNQRNADTIAIECCHKDKSGKFNKKTYASAVELTAWLLKKFDLSSKDVIRHYDVTGKKCPLYYVEHEDKWEQFKKDVENGKGR
ncbi:MAG: peptidoglycan recognition family protein [Lachnospiraceae bacterium]